MSVIYLVHPLVLQVMKLRNLLTIALGMFFFPAVASAQPPSFAWSWQQSRLGNSQCVRRATVVFSQLGFRNIDTVGDTADTSIYATNGDYTGVVRCITRQRMVIFLVTGPEGGRASFLETRLSESF